MSWVSEIARPDIVALKAYEHASWEPSLERLHANELPWRAAGDESVAGLNRYPEPQPHELVQGLADLYGVAPETVLVGRGSDEAIDLLTRSFCRAGRDAVVVCPPTFGMYAVSARSPAGDNSCTVTPFTKSSTDNPLYVRAYPYVGRTWFVPEQ